MTSGIVVGERRVSMSTLLVWLTVVAILMAILTPDVSDQSGGLSSYSKGSSGVSVAFELAQRMGWTVTRRETQMDSAFAAPSVQVVVRPDEMLGRREIHRLLENVRAGGGLVFAVGANDEIGDSLGLAIRVAGRLLLEQPDRTCPRRSFTADPTLPATVFELAWKRPPPGPVTSLMTIGSGEDRSTVAMGFPLGRGRVAVVGGAEAFTNEAVRVCANDADVLVARLWEYVRGVEGTQPLVFDEYHHGRGVHGGSFSAVSSYLARTGSGRFFATLLAAGVLLLFAASPRPIIPREPARIVRRSPLEHADALGRAYADVAATRTASARLVSGLRRRTARMVAADRKANDVVFLETVARRFPSLASQVGVLQHALREQTTPREFALSADAIEEIERVVTTIPPVKA